MLILGIFTKDDITAVVGSVEQRNGQIEQQAIVVAAWDVFEATVMALTEAALIRPGSALIYTNDEKLLKFLTPPISVMPTSYTKVKSWNKPAGIGGNPNQWTILYKLFALGRWQIKKAPKLPGTEAMHYEYRKSDCYQAATRGGVKGGARRLYEGVWTDARGQGYR